jgi:hypothetical protein
MGQLKKNGHMKIQVQKERKRWWAHDGSCIEKKKEDGHVSKNKL